LPKVLTAVGAFPKPFGPDHKAPGINTCAPELPPIGFSRCREGTVANSSLCYSCLAGSRRTSVRMPNFVSYGPGVVKSDKRRGFFLASWQRDMSFLDGAVPNSPSHPCREFGEAPLAPGTGLLHFRLPSDQSHTCAGPAMVGSGGWGLSIRPIVQRPNLEGGGNGYRPQNQTHRLRPREGGFRSTLKERLKARTLYSQAPFLPGAFPFRAALLHSINRTEISADAQTSFFGRSASAAFGSMIRAWVTWARRGLGRGELFRGFFVSPNPITQAR